MKCHIEKIITDKGLLKKYVAKQVGVTPSQLSLWMRMKNFPSADKLFKLAWILGCKVDDLYEYEDEKKAPIK